MSETALEDFMILRNFDEPIPEETFAAGAKEAMGVLQELNEAGVGIQWVQSHVRTQADGDVVGTVCHYRGEDEDAIRKHADRAGLPASRIDLHARTLTNE